MLRHKEDSRDNFRGPPRHLVVEANLVLSSEGCSELNFALRVVLIICFATKVGHFLQNNTALGIVHLQLRKRKRKHKAQQNETVMRTSAGQRTNLDVQQATTNNLKVELEGFPGGNILVHTLFALRLNLCLLRISLPAAVSWTD